MHILFDPNKLHKFWMSSACRNSLPKDGRNQRKSRPPGTFRVDRTDTSTYMGPIILLEQCDMFIRFHNKANIISCQWTGKAQGSSQGSTCQCQERQMGKPPILEAMWSVDLQHQRNGGLKGSRGRPPGLPWAAQPKIPAPEEDTRRTDVQEGSEAMHKRSVARWHNPRLAGLGWAARPHLAASQLLASRGS